MFQENTSFRLMEMGFRTNNGFCKKKEKLQIKNAVSTEQKFWFHQSEWGIRQKICVSATPKNCFHRQEYIDKIPIENGLQ